MNVLFFVDTHGSQSRWDKILAKAKDNHVDLMVCAGDFTVFEDHLDSVLFTLDQAGIPMLLIHGNHEAADKVKLYCEMFDNLTFIHKKIVEKDGVVFMGYGGGGFSQIDPDFKRAAKRFKKKMKKNKTAVLVLHAPPYQTKLDELPDGHHGNKDFTDFIKENQPQIVICGHFHENSGMEDMIGSSRILNPGTEGRILHL